MLGVAPTWKDFILAIPIGMIAYTGIETISNMAEEAKDEIKTIPAAIKRVAIAVFAIYFTLPAVALVALPVERQPDGTYTTLLGLPEEEGGFAGDPIAGVVAQPQPRGLSRRRRRSTSASWRRRSSFLATNAGLIGVSRLVYSMGIHRQLPDQLRRLHPKLPHAVDRDPRLRRRRDPDHAARARRRSSATSTRSGRCCRSRSRTWR